MKKSMHFLSSQQLGKPSNVNEGKSNLKYFHFVVKANVVVWNSGFSEILHQQFLHQEKMWSKLGTPAISPGRQYIPKRACFRGRFPPFRDWSKKNEKKLLGFGVPQWVSHRLVFSSLDTISHLWLLECGAGSWLRDSRVIEGRKW